ncbi:MAG: hypothetical protein HC854_09790 [Flavobacterium sp.]|nr:hypothetical protein [Flavobacterium sp.]
MSRILFLFVICFSSFVFSQKNYSNKDVILNTDLNKLKELKELFDSEFIERENRVSDFYPKIQILKGNFQLMGLIKRYMMLMFMEISHIMKQQICNQLLQLRQILFTVVVLWD